jgi:hypothetical protein
MPHYLGLMLPPIALAIHFANPKYWGTWQQRISYRLEENDMTENGIKSDSSQQSSANNQDADDQAKQRGTKLDLRLKLLAASCGECVHSCG